MMVQPNPHRALSRLNDGIEMITANGYVTISILAEEHGQFPKNRILDISSQLFRSVEVGQELSSAIETFR